MNKIPTQATTWRDLEDMLSERGHTQNQYCLIPLLCGLLKQANSETKSRTVAAGGCREQGLESHCLVGTQFLGETVGNGQR